MYPANDSDFQFISGVKKHLQFSIDSTKGVNIADKLEDIAQVSPIHLNIKEWISFQVVHGTPTI